MNGQAREVLVTWRTAAQHAAPLQENLRIWQVFRESWTGDRDSTADEILGGRMWSGAGCVADWDDWYFGERKAERLDGGRTAGL